MLSQGFFFVMIDSPTPVSCDFYIQGFNDKMSLVVQEEEETHNFTWSHFNPSSTAAAAAARSWDDRFFIQLLLVLFSSSA